MSDVFLPIEREGEKDNYNYFVMVDGARKELSGQITIYNS